MQDAISRRGLHAEVEGAEDIPNLFRIHYVPINNPKISIIIPSKNMADVLDKCLLSIFNKTTYQNFEVIIIDNGSDEVNIKQLYDQWYVQEPERFKVYSYNIPFNYSKLNNFGCTKATGELLLLLNNDVEVITPNWLEELAGQALRSEIGAVGACLYYPDHSIQHAGVILGIGGVAGHSHKYFPSSEYGYFSRLKMVSNYSAVTAACLMVRKEVYEEVGGLEEELQVAFNDVDFCLKIGEAGYRNIWLPQVQLFHYESKSRGHEDTPEKKQRFNSEVEWMRNRWSEVLDNDPCYNPNLTKEREDFSIG
ncbi:glycosyltransferase [Paenibacillus sp. D2_2]|uniref:glycosyltransferase family 2 protein n=1 Tax=Paenibacillus sp. D2_2 TaxID=3073092 RepID=UPI002814CE43|nr:glycosyltransferase [Paenibacillus sp. D2_2]WMT40594.1 glycosyltransferase [Paenibacillus sp. D2_2]